MSRISRRQFIASSAVAGLAGLLPRGAVVDAAANSSRGLVSLKRGGDAQSGYRALILFDGRPVAQHRGEGEFSAVFQNADRSLEDRVEHWRANSYTEDEGWLHLAGDCQLSNLKVTIFVQVEYHLVAPGVVRKQIRLHQVDIYGLFYQMTNSLEPLDAPASLWSFDQPACKGGPLHEYFPAAGFRSHDNVTVGLLTDAGYRNGWNRVIRRDGRPVKPAPHRITDTNLCFVCREDDRSQGRFFVSQTFGEELVCEDTPGSEVAVTLAAISNWHKRGELSIEENNGAIVLSIPESQAGAIIPIPVKDSEIYLLRFKYRCKKSFSVQVWDVDDRFDKLRNLTLYNDRVPPSAEGWSEFSTSVFVSSLFGTGAALHISVAESDQDIEAQHLQFPLKIELRDLQVTRMAVHSRPYHRLEMDSAREKTSFIFVDGEVPNTLRGYRFAAQRYLAEGLGFRGGNTEKVLYADLMMNCWSVAPENQHPMVAPSIWYSAAGEMYVRDSFFALNGIHNRELSERVFNLWGANQGNDGAINTLIEPNMANLERKSNDSTPVWLMWALENRRRFGTTLPMDKIRKAAEYCLRTYDKRHDGVCWAQFVMGQLDVVEYPEGTSEICQNQGMLAVTLRVIKELEIPGISDGISEGYIANAEAVYRSYYDPTLKFVRPTRDTRDAIGFGEIFPEFLSLWLFQRKILTGEMVVNHLDRIPVLLPRKDAPHPEAGGTVRPIFIGLRGSGKGWDYFTDSWHPMISNEHGANFANHNMDGIYYNGGSWLQIETCGYVTGKLHGWNQADAAIANRLWAEINISPDFPTSQEYLATNLGQPFFGYHRVFAWNAFIFRALEMAGVREPKMDPDYQFA